MKNPAFALCAATLLMGLVGFSDTSPPASVAMDKIPAGVEISAAMLDPAHPVAQAAPAAFTPPEFTDIPSGPFGDVVRQGRDIFLNTPVAAAEYVGNGLTCGNCHLDAGRLRDSAPLWGAYGRYPAYRAKNHKVNNFTERLQGCFEFSMNGKVPEAGSPVLVALETYAFWMAQGAPVGAKLKGAGYPKDFKPPQAPDLERGRQVYAENCALCHGDDGHGRKVADRYVFPPLWGADSFNWGAGMHELDNAAGFIQANMPLGRGGSLDDQQAWDVAMFMNSHERPQDPRYTGDVADTRRAFHDDPNSLYGIEINGALLGANPAR